MGYPHISGHCLNALGFVTKEQRDIEYIMSAAIVVVLLSYLFKDLYLFFRYEPLGMSLPADVRIIHGALT